LVQAEAGVSLEACVDCGSLANRAWSGIVDVLRTDSDVLHRYLFDLAFAFHLTHRQISFHQHHFLGTNILVIATGLLLLLDELHQLLVILNGRTRRCLIVLGRGNHLADIHGLVHKVECLHLLLLLTLVGALALRVPYRVASLLLPFELAETTPYAPSQDGEVALLLRLVLDFNYPRTLGSDHTVSVGQVCKEFGSIRVNIVRTHDLGDALGLHFLEELFGGIEAIIAFPQSEQVELSLHFSSFLGVRVRVCGSLASDSDLPRNGASALTTIHRL